MVNLCSKYKWTLGPELYDHYNLVRYNRVSLFIYGRIKRKEFLQGPQLEVVNALLQKKL